MAILYVAFIALCFFSVIGEKLLFLSRQIADTESHTAPIKETTPEKRYVYGIAGICEIFGCRNTY